jgi:hypothetical protein
MAADRVVFVAKALLHDPPGAEKMPGASGAVPRRILLLQFRM